MSVHRRTRRRAHSWLGPGELWGVRADESAARRHLHTLGGRRDGIITRADGTDLYGPIWNWTPSRRMWWRRRTAYTSDQRKSQAATGSGVPASRGDAFGASQVWPGVQALVELTRGRLKTLRSAAVPVPSRTTPVAMFLDPARSRGAPADHGCARR